MPAPVLAADPVAECIGANECSLDLRKQGRRHRRSPGTVTCAAASCPDPIQQACSRRINPETGNWAISTSGSRTFNVSINGTQVLSKFDIYAKAGAKNKAITETFTSTASSTGQLVIQFTSVVNESLVSAIEIE